jgi:hypothetical protein
MFLAQINLAFKGFLNAMSDGYELFCEWSHNDIHSI